MFKYVAGDKIICCLLTNSMVYDSGAFIHVTGIGSNILAKNKTIYF